MDQGVHRWRKSTFSGEQPDHCVEQGYFPDGDVAVRDTKEKGQGPLLSFSREQWSTFIDSLNEKK